MKKIIFAVIAVALIIAVPNIVFSQEASKTKAPMSHKEEMMCKMMKHKMPHQMMGGAQMVASGDGGVIIMVGNKLVKYDKDLNLVKDVEIKAVAEKMEKMREEMAEKEGAEEKEGPKDEAKEE